jgi:hypothetical protein
MILNKLKYKLEHKRESLCKEREDKVTLKIIVQTSVKKKKLFVSTYSFKQLLFSLYLHILVDMRANFWKAVNISLKYEHKIC